MNTTIDWFARWPEQALYSVASAFVSEELGIPEDLKQVKDMTYCSKID
jgi:hypothetical protein